MRDAPGVPGAPLELDVDAVRVHARVLPALGHFQARGLLAQDPNRLLARLAAPRLHLRLAAVPVMLRHGAHLVAPVAAAPGQAGHEDAALLAPEVLGVLVASLGGAALDRRDAWRRPRRQSSAPHHLSERASKEPRDEASERVNEGTNERANGTERNGTEMTT